jgi:hypothetical protein
VGGLLEGHTPQVQEHLALVLDGVPPGEQQGVYDRAIVTVLAAATRGESEVPVRDLLVRQAPDVSETAKGYGANLDLDEEATRESLEDAIARVEAHNRRVRERARSIEEVDVRARAAYCRKSR